MSTHNICFSGEIRKVIYGYIHAWSNGSNSNMEIFAFLLFGYPVGSYSLSVTPDFERLQILR